MYNMGCLDDVFVIRMIFSESKEHIVSSRIRIVGFYCALRTGIILSFILICVYLFTMLYTFTIFTIEVFDSVLVI